MADDRQPPQSYDTTTPAGVGASSSNQVSPGTIQEILDTGDSSLIDQAFDQMTVEDMIAYVDQLPSPPAYRTSSPAGVGSRASHSPSFQSPRPPRRLPWTLHLLGGALVCRPEREPPLVRGALACRPGLERL